MFNNNFIPKQPDLSSIKFKDDASTICDDLISLVNQFNESLDQEHEAGIMLASFGQTVTINVTEIGYKEARLIRFKGITDNGSAVELIQHTTQLNFLLVALKREQPEEPKKQIGFLN